jgi:hypothetical protein
MVVVVDTFLLLREISLCFASLRFRYTIFSLLSWRYLSALYGLFDLIPCRNGCSRFRSHAKISLPDPAPVRTWPLKADQ